MIEAVVCSPLRTPVGRFGGSLRERSASELAADVLGALVARTGLDPEQVDDVIMGQCYPSGEAPALGRVAALDAGFPTTVPGTQVDRRCGSGLQAVIDACTRIQTGAADVLIAGGAESMSNVEHYTSRARWGTRGGDVVLADRLARARVTAGGEHHPVPGGMVETAENLRRDHGVRREEQDRLALLSHQRAVQAQHRGAFAHELVPVETSAGVAVSEDEHPRPDTNLEALTRLRPVMAAQDPSATVTAGNSSGQNDGAAACIVTSRDKAEELNLEPLLRLVSWGLAGVAPSHMGIGPVPATEIALRRAGITMSDVDLIELNEAFAAQVLAVLRVWGMSDADFERVNVNGSGIALGHPVGATGARILATLTYEMRRRGSRYGLETMCIGGGQGLAAVFESV